MATDQYFKILWNKNFDESILNFGNLFQNFRENHEIFSSEMSDEVLEIYRMRDVQGSGGDEGRRIWDEGWEVRGGGGSGEGWGLRPKWTIIDIKLG